MTMNILLALRQGQTETPAVERAAALAKKLPANILIYTTLYHSHLAGMRFGDSTLLEQARKDIVAQQEKMLQVVRDKLIPVAKSVAVKAEWRSPTAQGIAQAAKQFAADLIIISSNRHSKLARLLLTNTDWSVLRIAPAPVLIAHHLPFQPYKTVMAAVDPTHFHDEPAELDHHLIRQANIFSQAFAGETHIGHGYPSKQSVVDLGYIPPPEQLEKWRKQHTRAVNELASAHHIDQSRIHLAANRPGSAIPAMAKEIIANLVVIGSISRSPLKRLLIGSTTEQVLDRLECDVLTIPAAD